MAKMNCTACKGIFTENRSLKVAFYKKHLYHKNCYTTHNVRVSGTSTSCSSNLHWLGCKLTKNEYKVLNKSELQKKQANDIKKRQSISASIIDTNNDTNNDTNINVDHIDKSWLFILTKVGY